VGGECLVRGEWGESKRRRSRAKGKSKSKGNRQAAKDAKDAEKGKGKVEFGIDADVLMCRALQTCWISVMRPAE
jgi:hypothetical protein